MKYTAIKMLDGNYRLLEAPIYAESMEELKDLAISIGIKSSDIVYDEEYYQ